jgi:hypothetical protein
MAALNWIYIRPDAWEVESGKYKFRKKIVKGSERYEVYKGEDMIFNSLTYWEFLKYYKESQRVGSKKYMRF